MFEPVKNGDIQDIDGEPYHQVDIASDFEGLAFLNAALEAFHSTERIGEAPPDSNDPARWHPIAKVTVSRTVDERGRVKFAVYLRT
jgi:hypothetical protein